MKCQTCNTPLNPAESSGSFCWCYKCRAMVPAEFNAWRQRIKAIWKDPTIATHEDIERMAKELYRGHTTEVKA